MMRPVALVTGAGQGIGRAIARRLHAEGFQIVVTDVDEVSARRAASELEGRAHRLDITNESGVRELAGELGTIDVLVNNAGIWRPASWFEIDMKDAREVLEVNVLGTLNCILAFGSSMSSGGSVVNLSSVSGSLASPDLGLYPASKAALETLTRQAAVALGPRSIRVNAIAPGMIHTEGTDASYADGGRDDVASGLPLQRIGTPEDVADVAAFLASDASRYMTGQVLTVDGGLALSRTSVRSAPR